MSEIFPTIFLEKFTTHLYFNLSNYFQKSFRKIFYSVEFCIMILFSKLKKNPSVFPSPIPTDCSIRNSSMVTSLGPKLEFPVGHSVIIAPSWLFFGILVECQGPTLLRLPSRLYWNTSWRREHQLLSLSPQKQWLRTPSIWVSVQLDH